MDDKELFAQITKGQFGFSSKKLDKIKFNYEEEGVTSDLFRMTFCEYSKHDQGLKSCLDPIMKGGYLLPEDNHPMLSESSALFHWLRNFSPGALGHISVGVSCIYEDKEKKECVMEYMPIHAHGWGSWFEKDHSKVFAARAMELIKEPHVETTRSLIVIDPMTMTPIHVSNSSESDLYVQVCMMELKHPLRCKAGKKDDLYRTEKAIHDRLKEDHKEFKCVEFIYEDIDDKNDGREGHQGSVILGFVAFVTTDSFNLNLIILDECCNEVDSTEEECFMCLENKGKFVEDKLVFYNCECKHYSGHCVHKSCASEYFKKRQEDDQGDCLAHGSFKCPHCNTAVKSTRHL